MLSSTVHPQAASLNAATFLLALGPRSVVVVLIRLLADRFESGGWAPPPLDIELAIRRLPKTAFSPKTRKVYAGVAPRLERVAGRAAGHRRAACPLPRRPVRPGPRSVQRRTLRDGRAVRREGMRPGGPALNRTRSAPRRWNAWSGSAGRARSAAQARCRESRGRRPSSICSMRRGVRRPGGQTRCSDHLRRVGRPAAGVRGLALVVDDVSFLQYGTARIRICRSIDGSATAASAVQYLRTATAVRLRNWMGAGGIGPGVLLRAVDRLGRVSERGLGPDLSPRRDQAPHGGSGNRRAGVRPLPAYRLRAGARRAGRVSRRASEGGALEGSVHNGPIAYASRRRPWARWRGCGAAEKSCRRGLQRRETGGARVRITRVN